MRFVIEKPAIDAPPQNGARKRILQAATNLFLTQGFLATKTRHIAERAGVNEALIFYHFKNKQNLRWTVLEDVRISTHVTEMIEGWLNSGLPDGKLFAGLAENLLRLLEEDDNMLRLLHPRPIFATAGIPNRWWPAFTAAIFSKVTPCSDNTSAGAFAKKRSGAWIPGWPRAPSSAWFAIT